VFAGAGESRANPNGFGSFSHPATSKDPHHPDLHSLRDLYALAKSSAKRYSVPVLWDLKTETIVNNESAQIAEMLNSEFEGVNLAPAELKDSMAAEMEWIFDHINFGVYKCGFTET
jgi:putative glutathione S-transferase